MDNATAVFSPIAHSHCVSRIGGTPTDWAFWKQQDLPMIEWADTLAVIRARGWKDSTGVQAEIEYARDQGTEIQYIDPIDYVDLIGVSGKKRSGKDTFANRLTEEGYKKYSLADPMKEAAKTIFGWSDRHMGGEKKEKVDSFWDVTPREVLQKMGTDMFRDTFGTDIWLKSMERKINTYLPRNVVVPDLRFPNEVAWVRRHGGQVIRIDASERLSNDDEHASETALDEYNGYDYIIPNNGTIREFYDSITQFVERYIRDE